MTETMLEKAARAICEEDARDPDDKSGGPHPSGIWLDEGEPWWTGYIGHVRAVLQAIRESDEAFVSAVAGQFDWGPPGYYDAPSGAVNEDKFWRAMIDAILQEKP